MMKCLVILLNLTVVLAIHKVTFQKLVKPNNMFTSSLYHEISQHEEQNFVASPYSTQTVLTFVQSGCSGETAQEIRTTLHLPNDQNEIESDIKKFFALLKGNNLFWLHSANKMYINKTFPIKKEFKEVANDVYKADVESIDFGQKMKATKTMNEWVEKKTNKKIKNLITSENLDEHTKTILINAIYFKGDWMKRFDSTLTEKGDFYKNKNDVLKVNMMYHYKKWFNYYEDPTLKAKFLQMPFEGEDVWMTVVLPNEREGLAALERHVDKVFSPHHYVMTFVDVALPKFKIESKLELEDLLKKLGIHKVFDEHEADLSRIAGRKGDLVIGKVIQKTYINVNEEGVEAAAATYVEGIAGASFMQNQLKPKAFIADHPFLFYIEVKKVVIFSGRVSLPNY